MEKNKGALSCIHIEGLTKYEHCNSDRLRCEELELTSMVGWSKCDAILTVFTKDNKEVSE